MASRRIVLGLQSTVDYEVEWDPETIGRIAEEYGITLDELSREMPINSARDLVVVLLAFVRDGVGGERFVASSSITEELAALLRIEVTLGGSGLRAGLAMRKLGVQSVLHLVSEDDNVRRLLPADCEYVTSATEDTLDPHLIIQFPQGARVEFNGQAVTAPHPNRIIFANDPPARELKLSDQLGDLLDDASVFLISGLNAIQEPDVLRDRMESLRELVKRLPEDALIYYEDAGFHSPELSHGARDTVLPFVDVFGLNEDELQLYLGAPLALQDPAAVAAIINPLRAMAPDTVTTVLHTKYFAMAIGPRAEEVRHAVRGGVVMASSRYLHGDGFTAAHYGATGKLPDNPVGVELRSIAEAAHDDVAVVPALKLDVVRPTTIGLGDTFVGGFLAAWATAGQASWQEPVVLGPNQPAARFYSGGDAIADLRALPRGAKNEPEDWVASTTTVAGEEFTGLSVLPDGRVLADEVLAHPEQWLGPEHIAAYGPDAMLLVKILDAGQRLPVHAHPHRDFTARMGLAHGKAEAWYILTPGVVYVGLTRDVPKMEMAQLVEHQDTSSLIGLLHRREVVAGDVVYVPPGVLHAIDKDVLLLEVQEPTDLSILLEWEGFDLDGARDGHLGLGFDAALDAVELRGRCPEEVDDLFRNTSGAALLPEAAGEYFQLDAVDVAGESAVARGIAVVLVESGEVTLRAIARDGWQPITVSRGSTVLLPWAAGDIMAEGRARLMVARPPQPVHRP